MIKRLKIFEIDPDLEVISNESEVMKEFVSSVDTFFKKHILNSIVNINSKAARFRNETSEIYTNCLNCFSENKFEEMTKKIADILKENMHYTVKKPFIFIIMDYCFEKKDLNIEDEGTEEILAIMKMDINEGIQIQDNTFTIHPNMLPDLGNHLQKCAFVYRSRIDENFKNNDNEGFHLRILDKQDKTISDYFMRLMNSVVVADDEVTSKLAQKFIKKTAQKYTNSEGFDKVKKRLRITMSQRKSTSISSIFTEVFPYLTEDKLVGKDVETLSNETFRLMLQSNPSVKETFISQPTDGEKYIITSKDREIWVSIEKGLIDERIVEIDEASSEYINLKLPKERINRKN